MTFACSNIGVSPVPLILRRDVLISQMTFACSNIAGESSASDFQKDVLISQITFTCSNIAVSPMPLISQDR